MSEDSQKLPALVQFLPGFIKRRIANRPNLVKILDNIGWLFFDKILRMGVGLIVGVWVARYLGPEQFGLLNYAVTFVALFSTLGALGLGGVVVKNLVTQPQEKNEILVSAFILQLFGSILTIILILLIAKFLKKDELFFKNYVSILSLVLIFKSTDFIRYWFESQVRSKYIVLSDNMSFLIFSIYKIYLIELNFPLKFFVYSLIFESALASFFLIILYLKNVGKLSLFEFNINRALMLLKECWPVLLSSIFVTINMHIDKIMLKEFSSAIELGVYSSATVLVFTWFFVPVVLGGSISPYLTKLHAHDRFAYLCNVEKAYSLFGIFSLTIAVLIYFMADVIVFYLYGYAYRGAENVLSISVWGIVFISIVSLRGRLLIIEGFFYNAAVMIFLGMLINIFLGIFLVPIHGAVGAAWAFSVSWGVNALIIPLLFRENRMHSFIIWKILSGLKKC